MEYLVTVLAYLAVFGSAAAIAGVLAVAVYFVTKKHVQKFWCYFGCVVAVLLVMASVSQKPAILYSDACTQMLTKQQEQSIRDVCGGAYSVRMPFIPVMVRVTEVQDDYTAWTEFYYPVGTREMELSGVDGYNCTKNLFPW